MKRIPVLTALTALLALWTMAAFGAVPLSINFQGILRDGSGNPVPNGTYSVTFSIYAVPSGLPPALWTETQSVGTTNGLFTVLLGSATVGGIPDAVLSDSSRYLGITVSPDPEMTPRQKLVSVAYGYRVNSVDGASGGTITSKVSIGPGHTNTGTNAFVAGENNSASGDSSTVGGGAENTVSGNLATISGGFFNGVSAPGGSVGGGSNNEVQGDYGTVGGGSNNTVNGDYGTIGGGSSNSADSARATVGGGLFNTAQGEASTVGGGFRNASGFGATVAGGGFNKARGRFSVVAGGGGLTEADSNSAIGETSAIGGGSRNRTLGIGSTVGGGYSNAAFGGNSTVGGGYGNTANFQYGTVAGGISNSAYLQAAVGGGVQNSASGQNSTVSGGYANSASALGATVGGGESDTASGDYSTIGGGLANVASGDTSTIGGGAYNRADFKGATVGGGVQDTASGANSTVGGGLGNKASAVNATVGGGAVNKAEGGEATVSGGLGNRSTAEKSTVGGGGFNLANAPHSTISGGLSNQASGVYSSVGGGFQNTSSGDYSIVGGGSSDTAGGENACVPGGFGNKASGRHSFAAGRRAKAVNLGSFVWADSSADADFASTANNQFLIRAVGGAGIGTNAPEATLHVHKGSAGAVTADGNSTGVFENSTHNFLSILRPGASDCGVLFGEPGSVADGGIVYDGVNNRLDLRTNGNVTKMSITAGGSVGIGTGSPADILQVVGDVRVGIGTTGCVRDADGTVIAGTCSSDKRLKTKIEPFPNILDELVELQPVHFYWKVEDYPEKHFGEKQSFGLIAQEVEKILPDLVTADEDGFKAVRYNKLPLLLLQAIKEQQKEIEELRNEITKLKNLPTQAQVEN